MGYIIICSRLGGKFMPADFCVFKEKGTVLRGDANAACVGADGAIIHTESVMSRLIRRRGRSRVHQRRFYKGMMPLARVRGTIVCLRLMDKITILSIIVGMSTTRPGIIA